MSTLKKSKKWSSPLKLNLGCGAAKLAGCVNIDVEESCKPDLIHDFTRKELPFETGTVSEVYLFHTIEHLRKMVHKDVLKEIHRVLKVSGYFYVSYPEFSRCVDNWKNNKLGKREFWEATIFGRQLYPSDHHVCIMDSPEFTNLLRELGFVDVKCVPEKTEDYNTVITCLKGVPYVTYEEMIAKTTAQLVIVK